MATNRQDNKRASFRVGWCCCCCCCDRLDRRPTNGEKREIMSHGHASDHTLLHGGTAYCMAWRIVLCGMALYEYSTVWLAYCTVGHGVLYSTVLVQNGMAYCPVLYVLYGMVLTARPADMRSGAEGHHNRAFPRSFGSIFVWPLARQLFLTVLTEYNSGLHIVWCHRKIPNLPAASQAMLHRDEGKILA